MSDAPPTGPPPQYEPPKGEYPGAPPPGYPPAQPGYPQGQPGYPPAQPGYPPAQPGYPPAQPGYPPQQQAGYTTGTTTVIQQQPVTQTVVMARAGFGPHSQGMQCPYCQAHITTSVNYQAGGLTWIMAAVICLVGCWLGCCFIPFCIDDCQDAVHSCPNCRRVLGTYSRM